MGGVTGCTGVVCLLVLVCVSGCEWDNDNGYIAYCPCMGEYMCAARDHPVSCVVC